MPKSAALPKESQPEPTTSKFIEVRSSGIHGSGVFAKRRIPEGEWIIQYVGEKVTKEESNRRGLEWEATAKKSGDGAVYLFILDDETDIDGNFPYNTARLINHSCDPNCEAQICESEDGGNEIWFVALRDIKKGEELVFNYGFDLESYEDHPCRCGAKRCVGFIAAEEYWKKIKKLEKKKAAKAERETKEKAARKKKNKKAKKRKK
ncbi:MAG: SET domain-containing protein-lysine N-methyltransferase [Verrucomicrobiales bacterium]